MMRSLYKLRKEALLGFSLMLLLTGCTTTDNSKDPSNTEENTIITSEEPNEPVESDTATTQPTSSDAEQAQPAPDSIASAASAKDAIARLEVQLPSRTPAEADQLLIELETFYQDHEQQLTDQFLSEPYVASLQQLNTPVSEEDLAALPAPTRILVDDTIAGKYRLIQSEGMVYPIVDYRELSEYAPYLSKAMSDYLLLMADESDVPSMNDASVSITWDELSKRTLAAETYLNTYPDSPRHMHVKGMLQRNLIVMLNGSSNTTVLENGFRLKAEVRTTLEQAASSPLTFTGQAAQEYLALVDEISANYSPKDTIDSNDPNYNRISQYIDSVMQRIETEF